MIVSLCCILHNYKAVANPANISNKIGNQCTRSAIANQNRCTRAVRQIRTTVLQFSRPPLQRRNATPSLPRPTLHYTISVLKILKMSAPHSGHQDAFKRKSTSVDKRTLRQHRRSVEWKERRDATLNQRRKIQDMSVALSPVIEKPKGAV